MIAVLDYGMGNVGSIVNILRRVGAEPYVSSDPVELGRATKLVLPGVGAFDAAVRRIRETGLFDVLNEKVIKQGVPILGVCLGMQLLMQHSDEGALDGFGWIRGDVRKFDASQGMRVPHMGWNRVHVSRDTRLTADLGDEPRFYFVHSYYVKCDDPADMILTANHGLEFCAALNRQNIFGVQFHPEKSHKFGMKLFENFVRL